MRPTWRHICARNAETVRVARCLAAARQRCTNPLIPNYENYGGRGIRFSDSLAGLSGARLLLEALGPRPSRAHTIDRIDNDGDYKIGNLRWATRKQQNLNRRGYGLHRKRDSIGKIEGTSCNDDTSKCMKPLRAISSE
jgi:hypothetical protein